MPYLTLPLKERLLAVLAGLPAHTVKQLMVYRWHSHLTGLPCHTSPHLCTGSRELIIFRAINGSEPNHKQSHIQHRIPWPVDEPHLELRSCLAWLIVSFWQDTFYTWFPSDEMSLWPHWILQNLLESSIAFMLSIMRCMLESHFQYV